MSQWSNSGRIVCFAALLGCLPLSADARDAKPPVSRTAPSHAAIAHAVRTYITSHLPSGVKPVGLSVSDIKTEGGWATACAKKQGLDPVDVVLKREKGHWVGVVYGTNLAGVGAKYHIPCRVWRKIGTAPYNE